MKMKVGVEIRVIFFLSSKGKLLILTLLMKIGI